jgi:signal transduction histidine kinase
MNKLWVRLSVTFALVVLVAVFIVGGASTLIDRAGDGDGDRNRFTRQFFEQPHGLVSNLTDYYLAHQGWDGVEVMLTGAQSAYFRREAIFLADDQQKLLYFIQGDLIGQPMRQIKPDWFVPVQVKGQTVGHFGLAEIPSDFPDDHRPSPFAAIVGNALLVIAIVGGIGGITFGVLMSRTITAPLNKLAEAARAIGSRNLSRRVEEVGSDEMRSLAQAFNDMADGLEQGETLRRNLLADVAHELRTPLSVLQGNLRAILDEVYPLSQEEIARLYEHSRLLGRLVNDLHELAQAEARQLPLDIQPANLLDLLTTTAETFRPHAESKNITLDVQLPDNMPPVSIDSGRIRQVLQNLLANAFGHTPAKGGITLHAQANAEAVTITVHDTGDGIAPEHLPHIFDRFYRADPARNRDRGGAGLGLAIARAIVESHGGNITVTSAPKQGSTFTVSLPLSHR